jgi:uncharacterized protein YbcI
MKSNPAVPGGSFESKPTWSSTLGCSATSAFFVLVVVQAKRPHHESSHSLKGTSMRTLDSSVAQQIAQAASAFEQRRTGHTPKSVAVILSENTLVITLRGALSPAEKALAQSPTGAAQVQEFHRQLFIDSADSLRDEIKRITGVEVREATAEVEPTSGAVMQVFTTGTVVQVFLLASGVTASSFSGNGLGEPSQETEFVPC